MTNEEMQSIMINYKNKNQYFNGQGGDEEEEYGDQDIMHAEKRIR